jgi:hypothetical protein
MFITPNLNLSLPESQDDVLVSVLSDAFKQIDTATEIVAGDGISVSRDTDTRKQTVKAVPATSVVSSSNTAFPSSKAVADFVQAQVSGSGTYQGQIGYFGTLTQIKAQVPASSDYYTGAYLASNNLYLITYNGSWPASGTVAPSQASGDSYDVRALLDYPAPGGGFESGQIRLAIQGSTKSIVITGTAKAVKTVSPGDGIAINNTDPFNPVIRVDFGAVASSNTTKAPTGAAVFTEIDKKQTKLNGTNGTVVMYGASAGTVGSRAIQTVPTSGSNALITSGAVYNAGLTLENEQWTISFAPVSNPPTALPNEKILWIHGPAS